MLFWFAGAALWGLYVGGRGVLGRCGSGQNFFQLLFGLLTFMPHRVPVLQLLRAFQGEHHVVEGAEVIHGKLGRFFIVVLEDLLHRGRQTQACAVQTQLMEIILAVLHPLVHLCI